MSPRPNINPKVWGPPAWMFLDLVAAGYPESASTQQELAMANFLTSLGEALPCDVCRANYKYHLHNSPPEFFVSSRKNLSLWLNSLKKSIKP